MGYGPLVPWTQQPDYLLKEVPKEVPNSVKTAQNQDLGPQDRDLDLKILTPIPIKIKTKPRDLKVMRLSILALLPP